MAETTGQETETDVQALRRIDAAALWEKLARTDSEGIAYLVDLGLSNAASFDDVRFSTGATGSEVVDRLATAGYRLALPLRTAKAELRGIYLYAIGPVSEGQPPSYVIGQGTDLFFGDVLIAPSQSVVCFACGAFETLALQLAGVATVGVATVDRIPRLAKLIPEVEGRLFIGCPRDDKTRAALAAVLDDLMERRALVRTLDVPAGYVGAVDWVRAKGHIPIIEALDALEGSAFPGMLPRAAAAARRSASAPVVERPFAKCAAPLDFALAYVRLGWRVVPLHSVEFPVEGDGRPVCSCGDPSCTSIGKHPRTDNGLDDATKSPKKVKQLWNLYPNANIGIVTGSASGLFVLDVDAGAEAAYNALCDQHPEFRPTLFIRTGGGGSLILFKNPADRRHPTVRDCLGPGLSTLGNGGYFVAPPSMHATGEQAYSWIGGGEPADVPPWLLEAITQGAAGGTSFAPVPGDEIPYNSPIDETASTAAADPYFACANDVNGDERFEALRELTNALVKATVRGDTVTEVLNDVNRRHCKPPLGAADLEAILTGARELAEARAAERKRRGAEGEPGGTKTAVAAYLRVLFSDARIDNDADEIEAVWNATGESVRIYVGGSDRELQKGVRRFMGALDDVAERAHPEAKGKLILRCLQTWSVSMREVDKAQGQSEPIALIETMLATHVWVQTTSIDGRPNNGVKTLADRAPGYFPQVGMGILFERDSRKEILVVNFNTVANGILKGAQFRNRKASELQKLFEQAPGFLTKRARDRESRSATSARLWALDLRAFREATAREDAEPEIEFVQTAAPAAPSGQDERQTPKKQGDLYD